MENETVIELSASVPVVASTKPKHVKNSAKRPKSKAKRPKSKVLFVGIGNVGKTAIKYAIRRFDPATNPFLSLLAVESNGSVLDSCYSDDDKTYQKCLKKWTTLKGRFQSMQLGKKGLGAGGDMEQGKVMATEKLDAFKAIIAKCDHVVFVAGGGGGSAGALEIFAATAKAEGKTIYTALTIPRLNEGQERTDKASVTYTTNVGIGPVTRIRNERIRNRKVNFEDFYKEINETSLFNIIWVLQAMLQEVGDVVDLDGKDWETGTLTGNYSTFGFFDAKDGLDGLEEGLLGNPYLEVENIQKATWIAICLLGKGWMVEDSDRIIACIQGEMENGGTNTGVQIKLHIQTKGLSEGVKMVGFVTFAKEPPTHNGRKEHKETKLFVADAQSPTTSSQKEHRGLDTTNEILAFPSTNNVNGKKFPFTGNINRVETKSEASQELVGRFNALFSAAYVTDKLLEEAQNVQKELLRETGLLFDIPTKQGVSNSRR